MTIEKRPSGKWRVRQMVNGKRFYVVFDYKPTKKEAEDAIRKAIVSAGERPNGKMTFEEAAVSYYEMKRNVLSPATVRQYASFCRVLPQWFVGMPIDDITQVEINKFVNEYSVNHSPKSVSNAHGFVSAVLGTFRPTLHIYTTLPQKRKIEPYTPSDEDVRRILAELRNTMFYVPIVLACFGMRRGEILALTPADVEADGTVHIRKSKVQDDNHGWIVKSTKTTASERDIIIPKDVADLIHAQGYVYDGAPNSIVIKLEATEKKLGIPHFSLHKLRHYFASKMLTITDIKTAQALGGWQTDDVLRTIYAHSMEAEKQKAKVAAVDRFSSAIFE